MTQQEPIYVHPDHVQETLQFFFDHTQWGESCEEGLFIEPDEWKRIIKEFQKVFHFDPIECEYIVEEQILYTFINEQVYQLAEKTMLDMGRPRSLRGSSSTTSQGT